MAEPEPPVADPPPSAPEPELTLAEPVTASEPDGPTQQEEYGPFFEPTPPSDTVHNTDPRKGKKTPILSVGNGAFCFVDGSHCKAALVLTAGIAAGMRVPASDAGPDLPYAHFEFRGGVVMRPLMFSRRAWHPWGVGAVASWSRGTGSVTVVGSFEEQDVAETDRTDAFRVGLYNQLWLSQKPHAMHIDFTFGTVNSEVLTSGRALWGTHAELGFGWGGWGGLFAGGDFLDRDTRVVFGFRGHGLVAGPIIGLALAGLAMGGAL
jgi:hypothetical protein